MKRQVHLNVYNKRWYARDLILFRAKRLSGEFMAISGKIAAVMVDNVHFCSQ